MVIPHSPLREGIMRAFRHALFLLCVAVTTGLVACASTNLAPIGSAPGSFVPEPDERQLWDATRQAEGRVLPARLTYEDQQLDQYLTGLVGRLVPTSYREGGGQPIVVRVRKDPRLNASAMPHGTVILHTGLLAHAENEAQLAGVLAHEIAHITHRHGARHARAIENRRTATNIVAFIGILAVAAAAASQDQRGNSDTADLILQGGPPLLTLGLNLTYSAMVSGYSRDLEREADEQALQMMARAGYDPREFKGFLRQLLAKEGDRGAIETFFYGSHPRLSERIEAVERASAAITPAGPPPASAATFDSKVARVRIANATYDAYLGRFRLAWGQMEKAAGTLPPSLRPVGRALLEGHVARAGTAGNRARPDGDRFMADWLERDAEKSYRSAISAGGTNLGATPLVAQAYKALGFLYAEWSDPGPRRCEAGVAWRKYLELQRSTSDRLEIQRRIEALRC
jgi:predicted Zn-dependent protease